MGATGCSLLSCSHQHAVSVSMITSHMTGSPAVRSRPKVRHCLCPLSGDRIKGDGCTCVFVYLTSPLGCMLHWMHQECHNSQLQPQTFSLSVLKSACVCSVFVYEGVNETFPWARNAFRCCFGNLTFKKIWKFEDWGFKTQRQMTWWSYRKWRDCTTEFYIRKSICILTKWNRVRKQMGSLSLSSLLSDFFVIQAWWLHILFKVFSGDEGNGFSINVLYCLSIALKRQSEILMSVCASITTWDTFIKMFLHPT